MSTLQVGVGASPKCDIIWVLWGVQLCSWHWVHLIVGRDAETFAGIIGKDPLCHQNLQLHIYVGKKTGKSRTSKSRCEKQGNLGNLWADVFEGHHRALLPCSLSSGWDGLQNVHICNPGTTNFSFSLTKIKFFMTWGNRQWKEFSSRTLTLLFGKHWKSAFRPQASCWMAIFCFWWVFRCASISWFQVVTQWLILFVLQLAHLRVFQIFFLFNLTP